MTTAAAFRTPLVWTGGLFVVLWLAPLADQIRHDPGNIRRLIEHFTSPDETAIGLRQAGNVMFRHLDVVDGYTRLFTGTQRFLQVGYEPAGQIWPGVVLFAVWIAAFVVAVRLGHRPLDRLARGHRRHAGCCRSCRWRGSSARSGTTSRCGPGGPRRCCSSSIVWTGVAWIPTRRPEVVPRRVGLIGGAALAVVVTLSMLVIAPATDHPEERLGDTIGEVLDPVVAALDPNGHYVVRYDDAYFFGSQAYGLVNELERAGFDVGMNEPWRVPVTAHRVIPVEGSTAEIIWATGGFVDSWRADDRVAEIASYDPRTAEQQAEYDDLRTALIADLESTGLDDLVPDADTDLFSMYLDPRLSAESQARIVRMLFLGQETAVFIGPPGVTQ